MTLSKLLFAGFLSLAATNVFSAPQIFDSGENKVSLIELYTSEGCSSCPPADRYVSALKKHPQLFKQFIPIALHVDYWDYIGWDDPFAFAYAAQRQRMHRRLGHSSGVYTPGFFVNGTEWRGFFKGGSMNIDDANKVGQLSVHYENQKAQLAFKPSDKKWLGNQLQAHIALVGFNLENDVSSGENHGKLLKHDFVVLQHQTANMNVAEELLNATFTLAKSTHENIGLVAWVENDLLPIQAVGDYLK